MKIRLLMLAAIACMVPNFCLGDAFCWKYVPETKCEAIASPNPCDAILCVADSNCGGTRFVIDDTTDKISTFSNFEQVNHPGRKLGDPQGVTIRCGTRYSCACSFIGQIGGIQWGTCQNKYPTPWTVRSMIDNGGPCNIDIVVEQ